MGRKNFERHFQESRHAFGMRALGLPNTKHFAEITRIEDALACKFYTLSSVLQLLTCMKIVAEKLKGEGKQEAVRAEDIEELEDTEGNVYNRKVSPLLLPLINLTAYPRTRTRRLMMIYENRVYFKIFLLHCTFMR